jgi:DMSO/TMAO reductase YedYZ molybdopterin-dependent catalytic subunit
LKGNTIIVIAVFVALLVAVVPLYSYTRPPAATTEEASLQFRGAIADPTNKTLTQLRSYTPTTVQVTISSSSRPQDNGVFDYTGVKLKTLLDQAQGSDNVTSVYVQASDGYGSTIPIQDALNENTIIAYQRNGTALTLLKDNGEGPLRLIIGNDQYAQRWVRGVVAIEVR